MNYSRFIPLFACAALMSACAPSGYYDSEGHYRTYSEGHHKADPMADNARDYDHRDRPRMGGDYRQPYETTTTIIDSRDYPARTTTTRTYRFVRPGYYDNNGYYIARESGPVIPPGMFPPRGMCRVWFPERSARYQPPLESCAGIDARVPDGAYVVYGG